MGEGSSATGKQTLIEHWDGTAWSIVPSPNTAGNDTLFGVAAVSTNDVWAVGRVNTASPPVIEHWNGTRWRNINAAKQAGFLDAVTAVSTNDVWAVGESLNASGVFQTLIEHWNGHKWSVVSSPNVGTQNNELSGVTAISAADIWAVGSVTPSSGGTQTVIEQWNGATWSGVSSPNPSASQNVLDAAAADPSSGQAWAVGDFFNNTSSVQQTLAEFNP